MSAPGKRELEDTLSEWLGVEPVPKRARDNSRLDARKREIAKLEAKLWTQAEALATTVKRLKSAHRSLAALKRAQRKRRAR